MADEAMGGGLPLPPGSWTKEHLDMLSTPPVLAPAETQEAQGWPFYEARLSIHVRPSKPTDTFGEGGDELAHARSWTQAPSFPDAVERLDADLGVKWAQVQKNAELVDVPPSPDVLPSTWQSLVTMFFGNPMPGWIVAGALVVFMLILVVAR